VQLLTEGLQAGAVIGGVRIVNPFDAASPTKTRRAKTR
jgi:predicted nucleic acid-binding protein